jgi:hypothetical protein
MLYLILVSVVWWYKEESRENLGNLVVIKGENKIKVEVPNPLAWIVAVIRTEDDEL